LGRGRGWRLLIAVLVAWAAAIAVSKLLLGELLGFGRTVQVIAWLGSFAVFLAAAVTDPQDDKP